MPARKKKSRRSRQAETSYWRGVFTRWVTVLAVLFAGIFFWQGWQALKEDIWDGDHQLNLVWASGPEVLVTSYLPNQGSLIFLRIPGDTYLETAQGFGTYRAEAVFPLGELSGKGGELLRRTVQENFGLPVDGFAVVETDCLSRAGLLRTEEVKGCLVSSFRPIILGRGQTNLGLVSRLRFFRTLTGVRPDKIDYYDLAQTKVVGSQVLPDGTQVLSIDRQRVDGLVGRVFADPDIAASELDFEVVNATDHPGLAAKVARILTNSGALVVHVGDSPGRPSESLISVKQKEQLNSYPIARFARVLSLPVRVGKSASGRAQVRLILAEDFWREYFSSGD